MTIQEARETVILAGKRLVESGLIARTWGNVSCRINDSHFVITPSGRDYLTLTPEEIVEVAINDCSYSGHIKPSSEKGIHAEVYKLYPDVNFVIHTHQDHASSVSVLRRSSIPVSDKYPSLKGEVLCADYGLPGTKKLRKGVSRALKNSKGRAVIMKNHGALCFHVDYESTFHVAQELENACEQFILEEYISSSNQSNIDPLSIGTYALSKLTGRSITAGTKNPLLPCESERTEHGFRLSIMDKVFDITLDKHDSILLPYKDFLNEARLHNEIYKNHPGINNILHTNTPGIYSVSCTGMNVLPLLDDFAQIAGTTVYTVPMEAVKVSAALQHSSTVFLLHNGALCCGSTKGDSHAVGIVTEKNSNSLITAALFGKIKYINLLESKLMRVVYLKKYSKQVNQK